MTLRMEFYEILASMCPDLHFPLLLLLLIILSSLFPLMSLTIPCLASCGNFTNVALLLDH